MERFIYPNVKVDVSQNGNIELSTNIRVLHNEKWHLIFYKTKYHTKGESDLETIGAVNLFHKEVYLKNILAKIPDEINPEGIYKIDEDQVDEKTRLANVLNFDFLNK